MAVRSFCLRMKVRDYECDLQGIVNNAIYQHYLEHARHEYLLSRNLNFAELTEQGVILVVVRAELDYLQPLRSGDKFDVSVSAQRLSRLRLEFQQSITRTEDRAEVLRARLVVASLDARGRPRYAEVLESLLTEN